MSSDDQYFLDVLGGISSDIKKFSAGVFDATDRQIDALASSVRSAFDSIPGWSARRPPPPPTVTASTGYYDRFADWLSKHRAVTAAAIAFVGTGGALIYYQRRYQRRRRRAKRAANGARKEVVVIAGPVSSPVTKTLMLDLEKRGYIVYVVAYNIEEEEAIKVEATGRSDIRPFLVDIGDVADTQEAMERFQHLLTSRHHAFPGGQSHELSFAGLVIAPDLNYQLGPIETIAPELWSDALTTKVTNTIALSQAFLPSVCSLKSRIILLTPNVVASLNPAFHGLESTVVHALDGFAITLRRELHTLGIPVVQVRLGNFDLSHVDGKGSRNHLQTLSSSRTIAWPLNARRLYAQNYMNQSRVAEGRGVFSSGENGSIAKASSPRELHHAVFDALTEKRPSKVYRVGRGSLAYDIVGAWVPGGIVGWVLGLRKVSLDELNGPAVGKPPEESFQAQAQSWEKVERE